MYECGEQSPLGYFCTREERHGGDLHIALGLEGEHCDSWLTEEADVLRLRARIAALADEYDRHDRPRGVHRFSVADRLRALLESEDGACGDWPAPCNCDDPTTHNGHGSSR